MSRSELAPGTLQFKIHGMDCAEEVAVLKQAVGPLVGGEERLAFDILNGRMTVSGVTDARPRATLGIATGAAATFAGVATLWAAIAADMGVSLLVIGNALRLLNSEA